MCNFMREINKKNLSLPPSPSNKLPPAPAHIRIRELDLLRGIAVVLMVIYHVAFDLHFFGVYTFALKDFPWAQLAQSVQVIFITTTGFTFALSTNKPKQLRHIKILIICALSISLVTWLLFHTSFVKFGILHFFAVAMLLTLPLKKLGTWNSLIGLPFLLAFLLLPSFNIDHQLPPWLFPLYYPPDQLKALDYFPLIPWYGLFLQGVALGSFLKKNNYLSGYSPFITSPLLEKIGSRTLWIYLVHQPFIAGLILFGMYIEKTFL
jgi:uncharacterized membrane protein